MTLKKKSKNASSNSANPAVLSTILLCCPGRFQAYFAHRLLEETNLQGIVIVGEDESNKSLFQRFFKGLSGKLNYLIFPWRIVRQISIRKSLKPFETACERALENEFPHIIKKQSFPKSIPICYVDNINSEQAVKFVQQLKAEMICVNGTNLLREPMLELEQQTKHGIINLHTGLSPYARGGNCNLFSLIESKPELIGATIHYIDAGIDSGEIICTFRPTINPQDTYEFIEAKVFIQGIDKLIQSIPLVVSGKASRVSQWTDGKLYLRRTGYEYHPKHRLQANQKIKQGVLLDYLENKIERDAAFRLVELPIVLEGGISEGNVQEGVEQ